MAAAPAAPRRPAGPRFWQAASGYRVGLAAVSAGHSAGQPVAPFSIVPNMTALVADGRIHPASIEEAYEKAKAEVEQSIRDAGEWALVEVGIGPEQRSQQAIGYRELHEHLRGDRNWAQTVALIKRNSRRYARRQMSWYRGNDQIEWSEEPSRIDLVELQRYLLGFRP